MCGQKNSFLHYVVHPSLSWVSGDSSKMFCMENRTSERYQDHIQYATIAIPYLKEKIAAVNACFCSAHFDLRCSDAAIRGFRLFDSEHFYASYFTSRRLAFCQPYRKPRVSLFWCFFSLLYPRSVRSQRRILCQRASEVLIRPSPVCFRLFI